jgi:hypothetical protein
VGIEKLFPAIVAALTVIIFPVVPPKTGTCPTKLLEIFELTSPVPDPPPELGKMVEPSNKGGMRRAPDILIIVSYIF